MAAMAELSPDQLEHLADMVAERLACKFSDTVAKIVAPGDKLAATKLAPPPAEWLKASDVAERFGVSRSWVYDHAAELGAVRLGDGQRPRLRFDARRVAGHFARDEDTKPTSIDRPRKRTARPTTSAAPLLPIHDERTAA